MTRNKFIVNLGLIFFFTVIFQKYSFAQTSLTVSVGVGDTNLSLNGYTIPNVNVTFIENSIVIGTTVSDINGFYSKDFFAMSDGIHNITIYSTDPNGVRTNPLLYSISLTPNTTTLIENIYLPPTLNLTRATIKEYSSSKAFGYTIPFGKIKIYTLNGDISNNVTALATGYWETKISSEHLKADEYTLFAKVLTSNNEYSEASLEKRLTVTEETKEEKEIIKDKSKILDNIFNNKNKITNKAVTNFLLGLFPFLDKNSNGKIDYDEIYDTISFWTKNWRQGNLSNCDLDNNKKCDLVDFSVTLYYL